MFVIVAIIVAIIIIIIIISIITELLMLSIAFGLLVGPLGDEALEERLARPVASTYRGHTARPHTQ